MGAFEYEACIVFELERDGFRVAQQVPLPLIYEGIKLADVGYRIDLLVEDQLIVEVKAVENLAPVHHAQLPSYLKLSGRRLGLLINFNTAVLRNGISRRVNRL